MTDNATLITDAHAAMAQGDGRPFAALIDEAVVWRTMATGRWDLTFRGRQSLRDDLFAPLYAQFDGRLLNHARRVFADGDTVIMECEGEGTTKTGRPYNNRYAMFYRLAGGKVVEIREYLDTALADAVLEFNFVPAAHAHAHD